MGRIASRLWTTLIVLLVAGAFVVPSIYLDVRGIVAPATVVEKQEQIDRGRRPSRTRNWFRRTQVVVEYQPPEQSWPSRTAISVDEATYDRLRVGDSVRVRYQPEQWMRDFVLLYPQARLEQHSTLTTFAVLLSHGGMVALSGVLLLVLIVLAGKARSVPIRAALLTLAALDLGVFAILSMRPAFLFDRPGPRATATATIRNVARFTERPVSRRSKGLRTMWGPFDRVEIEVEDGGRTVVAVDDIDAGSVPGLAVGSRVAVSYPPDRLREARIVDARRRHVTLNRLNVIAVSGQYLGILLALVAIAFFWDRARRRRRRLPLPQHRRP